MRKLGYGSIQSIINRACKEYLKDVSETGLVSFRYRDHLVLARFRWSESRRSWYVASFDVVYSKCVMKYFVHNDYDFASALCR